ncbi:MAG: peptide ABC transporter substrate-binding protein [Ardenticatenaceae bacterium]|nr:peptide ABC transporter substrate-binding protein [Ardenticatenaceae bacterium]
MKIRVLVFSILALLLGLAACQAGEDGPRLVSDWQPTAVGTRPLRIPDDTSQTVNLPEVPTREPTVTPVADVVIPTMAPTAVPVGVYVRELDGFTLHYPPAWEFEETEMGYLRLDDPQMDIVVIATSEYADEETTFATIKENFTSAGNGFLGVGNLHVVSEEEIPYGTEGSAQMALLEGDGAGEAFQIYLGYIEENARALTIVAVGKPGSIAARRTTLDLMVAQAFPGGDRLLGYDRNETLVLQGSEPLPRSLDPAQQTGSAADFVGLLYSGLVRLSPEMQVVPDLAERWDVSTDGTVYTFTLGADLAFADGRPLTAADVQYSWERAADPDTNSTTADTYMGDILGFREKLQGEADTIRGVRVVDDRTLEVTLDRPKPYFLAKLTYPVSFVLDSNSVADKDLEDWVYEPNASGPYVLADRSENEYFVFERNDKYHAPSALPRVVFLLSRIGNPISLFEAGEVDVAYLGAVDSLEVRQPSHQFHENWQTNTSLCTTLLQFNNTLPPMDDPLVRQALALSVDKEKLNDLLAEGTNLVASTILPPGMPGFDAELAEEQSANMNNVEVAQAALAASSYADGLPPLIISAAGFGDSERDDLNAISEMWREALGVEVSVEFLDPVDFKTVVAEERGHIVSYGWCADYPDPENFLDILYHTGSEFNVGGYTNSEVDALLEAARVELDVASRLAMYQEIEQLLLEDAAAIPLSHGVSDALVSDRVNGFVLAPMGVRLLPQLSLTTMGEE